MFSRFTTRPKQTWNTSACWKLKTKILALIYLVGMTTSLIFDFGKPVSIKSLFNMQYKSLLLTILFTSMHLAWAISLTLYHNSACRALLKNFGFFRVYQQLIAWRNNHKYLRPLQEKPQSRWQQLTNSTYDNGRVKPHCFVKSIHFFCYCSDEINC